jgi:hypothetical protein
MFGFVFATVTAFIAMYTFYLGKTVVRRDMIEFLPLANSYTIAQLAKMGYLKYHITSSGEIALHVLNHGDDDGQDDSKKSATVKNPQDP